MIEYYGAVKVVHMSCAALSISGFILRGYWVLTTSPRSRQRATRLIPMTVDTLLLGSALMLAGMSQQWPFQQNWLSAKLAALLVYILLGMVALHWGRSRGEKALALAAAVTVFAYIVAVALQRTALPLAG